jgi:hypothetical protein
MKRLRPLFAVIWAPWLLVGAAPSIPPQAVVETYSAAFQEQNARLRGASMEVEIEARLPKLKKRGRLHALRHISRLGRITYDALHFEGDNTIKNNVIARYLSAEVQAQAGDGPSLAIMPANYKFKYKGRLDSKGREVRVFQLTPRKKRVGLFKGELWLDAETCLPVRESGRLVKTSSVFLRSIEFVREYEIRDGVAIPRRIKSVVETRLVGQAELTIDFRNVSLAESPAASIEAGGSE